MHRRPSDIRPINLPARQELARSINGKPIDLVELAGEAAGGPVLIFAGIHGNESTTSDVANYLIDALTSGDSRSRPNVVVVPALNPDGLLAQTRSNARKIDLNRNFPAANFPTDNRRFVGGARPLSEPESQALYQLVVRLRPSRILSIHSIARGRHGNNFDGPAQAIAELLARHNGYPVLKTMGYPTPGSFGSWAGQDLQIPTITLELPRDATAEQAWEENRNALLTFIRGQ